MLNNITEWFLSKLQFTCFEDTSSVKISYTELCIYNSVSDKLAASILWVVQKRHRAYIHGVTFQKTGNIISSNVRIFFSILLGCGSVKAKRRFYNSKDVGRQKLELLPQRAVHLSLQQMT
jgi:hypothetical protein